MTKSRGINRPRHRWTKRELAILRRDYPHKPTRAIAAAFALDMARVYAQATNLGLHKSAAFQASDKSGRILRGGKLSQATQFKPGQVPANKGLRRPGWGPGRMKETQFKKGVLSPRCARLYKPIGAERVNSDGYRERKITDSGRGSQRWRAVHVLLWEEARGPIPPGHALCFKDGDKTHVTLGNFELITRAELGRRNVMWRKYPKELAGILQLRGAVTRQINRRLGRKEGKDRECRKATRRVIRNARRASGQGQPDGHRTREGRSAGG